MSDVDHFLQDVGRRLGSGQVVSAREIGQANHSSDRISCIKAFSTRMALPEKADVVVAAPAYGEPFLADAEFRRAPIVSA